MNKIEQIKELKLLLDSGILNNDQYTKLLNEIIEKSETNNDSTNSSNLINSNHQIYHKENIEEYKSVKIGNQTWMDSNLNVKTFRNGDAIPEAPTERDWKKAQLQKQPAWCYYNDDPANGDKYGLLYNIYALYDSRGLAPEGWDIPSEKDYKELINCFGGEDSAGRHLKSRDDWYIGEWKNNEDEDFFDTVLGESGTNKSGFNVRPGGFIDSYDVKYSEVRDGTRLRTSQISNWGDNYFLTHSVNFNGDNRTFFLGGGYQGFEYVRCLKKDKIKVTNSTEFSEILINYENKILDTFNELNYKVIQITTSQNKTSLFYKIVPDRGYKISTIQELSIYFVFKLSQKLNISISDIKFIAPIPEEGTLGLEILIDCDETFLEINIDNKKGDKQSFPEEINQENTIIQKVQKSEKTIEVRLLDNGLKINCWLKKVGQEISFSDSLFTFEIVGIYTEEIGELYMCDVLAISGMEDFATFKGTLTNIFLEEGDYTPNTIICTIEPDENLFYEYMLAKKKASDFN